MKEMLARIRLATYILRYGDGFIRKLVAELNINADELERAIVGEDKKNDDTTSSS